MMNKVILIGHLGKEPEVRYLESGIAVANMNLATSEYYKDKKTGEKKQVTDWHRIVLFGAIAQVAEKYLNKGDMISIEGKIRTRSYEVNGDKKYITEVMGNSMEMLKTSESKSSEDAKQKRAEQQASDYYGGAPQTANPPDFDDLPDNGDDGLPF